jgi:hypothetical protein
VVKYTTSNSLLWSNRVGPSSNEDAYDASADASGVFSGQTTASFSGTHQGSNDGFGYKFSDSSSFVWAQQQGTASSDITFAVLAHTSSEVYATDTTYDLLGSTNSGNGDAFLRRLNGTSGATVWTDQ